MSGRSLFLGRCWQDVKFQTKAIHSVVDWTIALYLIIPGIAIFIGIYRSWWLDTPKWIEGIPLAAMFILLYFFCWAGGFRTFLQDADQLFLLQKKKVIFDLKKWAMLYSILLQGVGMLLVFAWLSPFLIGYYGLSWLEVTMLSLFYCISKWLILMLNKRFEGITNQWLKAAMSFLLFGSAAVVIVILTLRFVEHSISLLLVATLVFLVLLLIQIIPSVTTHTTALVDINHDRKQKLKYVRFILMSSEFVPKTIPFSRKRPWLFRNSGRIYALRTVENGLVELFIKAFFRNGSHLMSYLQIMGVSISAIILFPPVWMKWTMYVLFLLFMKKWLDSIWGIVTSNPLLAALSPDKERMRIAKKRVLMLFLTPGYVFVGLIAILSSMFVYLF
ncbi:ABC transporter permease [Alkalihalobacillus sp. AL-G]|uniref:ABC transporter permease n=1 Tax=Alkalihalobacillus sp. AL-G TaxID=2926399 RepID=UPI00272BE28C|nr:ABC transporter permease [Alkalihalobacillus sp. AL-G]WLD94692.1 ABC transporter permease [Alkalihalobacillus sp. AL-G]